MELFVRPLKCSSQWLKILPMVLLLLALARPGSAQVDTFYNNGYLVNYTQNIIATNFVNDGVFSYSLASGNSWISSLYENWYNTQNFVNNGEMDCNTGFRFDNKTGHVESANFSNYGPINCGTNNFNFYYSTFFSGPNYVYTSGFYVWATNIYNSGTITVGAGGLARLQGDNIAFYNGSLAIQSAAQPSLGSGEAQPNIYATGQTGQNTNNWYPSFDLNPTTAQGSPKVNFYLNNSVPYFDVHQDNSGSNILVRMVFLQDTSANVATNVYFDGQNNFANGGAHIEWVGTYTDPVSGQPVTHYLYLDDDMQGGESTNVLNYTSPGVPFNYTFITTTTPRGLGTPAPSGFINNLIPPGNVNSNIYSYVNAQVSSTSVSTNQVYGGAVNYLPGRVEISAAQSLNLALASITGMNYLLLNSTNEFDSDGQSVIASPYADIYLGHTNGNLTIANLIASAIPAWSGSVQAWTSGWLYTDPNTGINYDFRVLLVASQLTPVVTPLEQDFELYSSNNVVISDVLDISRTFSLNCTNLLLTTNGPGAASLDGELNLLSSGFSWAASTPRLRCLTNYGAIRTVNQDVTQFGSVGLPYLSLVNDGLISSGFGVHIFANDFENNGGTFSAGGGPFTVQSQTSTISGGVILAGGIFTNVSGSLVLSGTSLQVGRSITLVATNRLTDLDVTNGSFWSLGAGNFGFGVQPGLSLPVLPATGDLLATTITNIAVSGSQVSDLWAGQDRGYSSDGFHNNAAIGQLVLDAQGATPHAQFIFNGTGASNAIYVDCLQLLDYAGYNYRNGTNLPALAINTNLVIYYAQAISEGVSVAEKINHFNTNHLRWVPGYAGTFSSTTLVYPDGTTNVVNAALAISQDIDSNGNGTPNYNSSNPGLSDPAPIFVQSEINFVLAVTNRPPLSARLQWATIPNATNYVYYKTNLLSSSWLPLTNFNNFYYSTNIAVTNSAHVNWFVSPQPYPGPATNVWVFDPLTNVPHYYRVTVQPWWTYPF